MHTVCICNNCYSLLNDDNQQTGALQTRHSFDAMKDAECPKCKTDGFLADLANTMKNKRLVKLIAVRLRLLNVMASKGKKRMPQDVIDCQTETFISDIQRFKNQLQRL